MAATNAVIGRSCRHLVAVYLSADPRSLGLFRILLGLVLLSDLYQRYLGVDYWYTDDGIVPTHTLRYGGIPYLVSAFFHASTRSDAVLGMALCAAVYLVLIVGFGTRLMQVLALVAVVSLNSRVFFLENGGHYVLNLLCVWSLFLPLGRRFSVDAWLRALRSRGDPEARAADDRLRRAPVVSLAYLALLLQFAVIYLFNVIQKTGPTWKDGSAVHYVLWDERIVRLPAVWLREILPYPLIQGMTWTTLAVESAAVLLILCPLGSRHCRLLAVLLLPALHLAFDLCLHLGIFSYAMASFFALLLTAEHWERLSRLGRRLVPARTTRGARLLRALEGYHGAWRRFLPAVGCVRVPRAMRRVTRVGAGALRELAVVVLLVAAVGDLATNNPAWPEALRYEQPEPLKAIIWYPRIRQFWRMFTPEPSRSVTVLSVEARTADGRTVDPYNEVASRLPSLPTPDGQATMPDFLNQDQLFTDYSSRFHKPDFAWLRTPLTGWILRYHQRTGNPDDRIVKFWVHQVVAMKPPPESKRKGRMSRQRVYAYP